MRIRTVLKNRHGNFDIKLHNSYENKNSYIVSVQYNTSVANVILYYSYFSSLKEASSYYLNLSSIIKNLTEVHERRPDFNII